MRALAGRHWMAGTSPDKRSRYELIWVYLCDLWALFVVGILEADGESGGESNWQDYLRLSA
jgi:hypothetical protein